MSFILDALRKSEHDRQREKGPGLAEVAVSPPKPRKNIWATVAVGLLVINLVAVGVLLLRRAGEHSSAAVPKGSVSSIDAKRTAGDAAAAPGSGTAPRSAGAPRPADGGTTTDGRGNDVYIGDSATSYPSRPVAGTVPPVLQPALPADDAGGTHNPLADELGANAAGDENYDAGYDGGYPAEGAPYPTAPPGMSGPATQRGSVVYE